MSGRERQEIEREDFELMHPVEQSPVMTEDEETMLTQQYIKEWSK